MEYSQHFHNQARWEDLERRRASLKQVFATDKITPVPVLRELLEELRAEWSSLPRSGTPDNEGVVVAAKEVLQAYQVKLRELEATDDPLPFGVAMNLSRHVALARLAYLNVRARKKEVKEIEFEASNGEPRAICMGVTFQFYLESGADDEIRVVRVPRRFSGGNPVIPEGHKLITTSAFGCFRVFRDTTHGAGGGIYWREWCPNCAPNTGQSLRDWRRLTEKGLLDHVAELQARR